MLLRRLEFQRLLNGVSTQFINMPVVDIDRHITQILGRVASFLGFNLAAIAQFSGLGSAGKVTHIWTAEGLPPIPPGFTELDFPWVAEQLTLGKAAHLTGLGDFPPEAGRDRQTYERFAIQSTYNWPLQVGGAVLGCLSFSAVASARPFPAEFEEDLELLAQVVASTLARARADQALRESEERLNLAADAAAAGLWSLNLATNCFWLTAKTRELFGFAADEVVTFERFLGVVHPDDRELIRQAIEGLVRSRDEGRVEYRILRPGGCVCWMLSRGRIHADPTGNPVYLTGVSLDITEPKHRRRGPSREARLLRRSGAAASPWRPRSCSAGVAQSAGQRDGRAGGSCSGRPLHPDRRSAG